MSVSDSQKEFSQLFKKLSYHYSTWQVWNDFLYMSAVSMANTVPTQERERRESEYLKYIGRYKKEEQELFPQLFALLVMALENNPEQDFLGEVYHQLELQQKQKGQFFTPYYICQFMSEIQLVEDNIQEELEQYGYISVNDPACGAGAMLIAFANCALKHNINYQQKILFVAQDIDQTAALMCYIQLSLLSCSAIIIIGDSLAKPRFHPDNQVWYTPMYYLNQWRFQKKNKSMGVELPEKLLQSDINNLEQWDSILQMAEDGQISFQLNQAS